MTQPEITGAKKFPWFKSFQYDAERDSPSDARNVLLVVAALITAVTFQAGVNPPGGVWQDTKDNHTAGHAIYATDTTAYYVFLSFNTVALSSSVLVIVSLTFRFPFHFEIWVSTISMIVTEPSRLTSASAFASSSSLPPRPSWLASSGRSTAGRICVVKSKDPLI